MIETKIKGHSKESLTRDYYCGNYNQCKLILNLIDKTKRPAILIRRSFVGTNEDITK